MLGNITAVPSLAVKDMTVARAFYEGLLGLQVETTHGDDMLLLKSGETRINLYRSDFAGTNQATALTWAVGPQLEQIVEELRAHAIAFEHYDMPGVQRTGDVHDAGGMKTAWFKDPDGNILNLINA